MYQKKAIVEKDVMIQGEIKQLYNNCPKEDGWFGGKGRANAVIELLKLNEIEL